MIQRAPIDPATHVHWTRFVGNADIEPRDMPPRAVLFVRRLPDPLPRRAQPHWGAHSPSPEWEASVRAALSDWYRRSIQTRYAAVISAPASAVAFADPADMLAALSIDLRAGEARRRWWWKTSLRELPSDPAEAICAAWIAQALLAPAVIERLVASGAIATVLSVLSVRQVWLILSAIARAFELTSLITALNEPIPAEDTPSDSQANPPWTLSLPASLSAAHQLLAGFAVTLRRSPHRVQGRAFREQTVRWFRSVTTVANPDVAAGVQPANASTPIAEESARTNVSESIAEQASIETQLAGIFYLINLLQSLDLFRGLERWFGIGWQISGWALVELVARCLFTGRERRSLLSDPVWELLAALDGRPNDAPIAPRFFGRADYTLPATWTSFLQPAPHHLIHFRGDRAQVWHPLGFLLSDAPVDAMPSTTPLRRHIGRIPRVHAAGRRVTPELRRFLAFLIPYVRYRLTAWLGDDLARGLLMRRARIHSTAAHIDVMLPMDAATVPVRAAGLDANPGWCPQLGRIVTFHYT